MTNELFPYAGRVEDSLGKLHRASVQLAAAIRAEDGFLCAYQDGKQVSDAAVARDILCQQITQWDRRGETSDSLDSVGSQHESGDENDLDSQKPTAFVGACAVSPGTIQLAEDLNHQKKQWIALHNEIRKQYGKGEDKAAVVPKLIDEVAATNYMRRILKHVRWSKISLDASDCLIPLLEDPAISINWFNCQTKPGKQTSLGDLITALKALADNGNQKAEDDLLSLEGFPHDTPVAYRGGKRVESVRYRAITNIDGSRSDPITGYARNPILYPSGGGAPKIVAFERRRKPGAGRPENIGDVSISTALKGFYWYNTKPTPKRNPMPKTKRGLKIKKPREPGKKTHNPYASTLFPGLWLGTRPTKSGYSVMVMIKVGTQAATSVSATRLGLTKAWEKAAKIYCEYHELPLEEVLIAQPHEDQVESLLRWMKGSQ